MRPDYAAIDAQSGDENAKWEALLDNLTRQNAYLGELEATLTCYEESQ